MPPSVLYSHLSSPRFTSAPASSSPPPTSSSFATLPFLFFCRRLAMRGACIPGHTLPPDGLLPFLLVRETSRQRGNYLRFPFRMYSGILRVSKRDWRQFWICSQCGRAGNFGSKFQSFTRVLAIWFIFQRNIFAADYNWHAILTELCVFP